MGGKLIKNYRDFPEWFKEKEYPLIDSLDGWHAELKLRFVLRSLFSKANTGDKGAENRFIETITHEHPFVGDYDDVPDDPEPVNDISILEVLYLHSCIDSAGYEKISDKWREMFLEIMDNLVPQVDADSPVLSHSLESALSTYIGDTFLPISHDDEEYEASEKEYDALDELTHMLAPPTAPYLSYRHVFSSRPVAVNLEFDDKTLKDAFSKWLAEARQEEGDPKIKRQFTTTDFIKWNKYKVLQVFDLDMWAFLSGTKITDNAIASVLWPDNDKDAEDITPIYRLRKVARVTVKTLLEKKTIDRLSTQLGKELEG